jgi:hypothetical protein
VTVKILKFDVSILKAFLEISKVVVAEVTSFPKESTKATSSSAR